ncbi:MAG TPA: hypothetical protein VFE05_07330 [Longimicrobiaceae bacterium]|jgi:hypothetical protein|nr:hypothetical protein [Longimicrobiaceae bacterium]
MQNLLVSPWLNVVAGVVGGLSLGWGIGRLLGHALAPGAIFSLMGVILLWWALVERRKVRRGTPESELDGSHTVE